MGDVVHIKGPLFNVGHEQHISCTVEDVHDVQVRVDVVGYLDDLAIVAGDVEIADGIFEFLYRATCFLVDFRGAVSHLEED